MHTSDKNSVLERRAAMMARLQQIHDHAAGEGTAEGAMIVTLEGYISGIPEFFTNDCHEGFQVQRQRTGGILCCRVCGRITKPAST
jgi:hypothetical protein